MSEPTIAVLDYGMGNLRSVCRALEHVGARPFLTTRPEEMASAAGVVFPGQGALGDCVAALEETGLDEALRAWIGEDRPYLGVCLGLQALFESSEEAEAPGLGIFRGVVRRFDLPREFKIPHMGWNAVRFVKETPLSRDLATSRDQFYFVHSYYVVPEDPSLALCLTDYGGEFVSGIERGNCFAVQYHPEKSQAKGLQIYRNFVEAAGAAHV